MKRRISGFLIVCMLNIILSPALMAADNDADFNKVRDSVVQVQSTLPSTPGVDEEEQRGLIGGIIARIFDASGVIYSRYLESVSGIFGNTSGLVPRWNGDSFEAGIIRDLGNEVRINGDIVADDFYKTDGSPISGKFYDGSPNANDAVYTSGEVGIGTVNPGARLHVIGQTRLQGNTTVVGNLYLNSGTLNGDSITDNTIDSTEIQNGTILDADIASINGAKITSGTVNINRLPGDLTSKIPYISRSSETYGTYIGIQGGSDLVLSAGEARNKFESSGTSRDTETLRLIADNAIEFRTNLQNSTWDSAPRASIDNAGNLAIAGVMNGDSIADNTIDSSEIQNRSITGDDIAQNTIGFYNIAEGGVRGSEIADGTVRSVDIEDNSLTASDLANNSVGNGELIDNPTVSELFVTTTGHPRLEMRDTNGGQWPYIDFSDDNSSDYDIRIRQDGNNGILVQGGSLRVDNYNLQTDRDLYIGENGASNSNILMYDDNSNTWRGIRWNDSANRFELEKNNGSYYEIMTNGSSGDLIANGTIDSSEIQNGTITGTDIANRSITGDDIAQNTIGFYNIAEGGVRGSEIANGTIKSEDLHSSVLSSLGGIGVGQSWRDSVLLNANQSYRNTTGKPIMVNAYKEIGSGGTWGFYVSSNNSTWIQVHKTSNKGDTQVSIIVPAGHYYKSNYAVYAQILR